VSLLISLRLIKVAAVKLYKETSTSADTRLQYVLAENPYLYGFSAKSARSFFTFA